LSANRPSLDQSMNGQILRRVSRELRELASSPLEGILVEHNEADVTEIHAILVGPPGTPFHGGEFRIKLKLGSDFPSSPPKGYFLTKVFHPNVAPSTGEICVNTLKRDWKESYGLSHILLTIKCLLIAPNPESALNDEAGRLLLEAYDDYCARAKTWTSIHARPTGNTAIQAVGEDKEDKGADQEEARRIRKKKRRSVRSLQTQKKQEARL